MEHELKVREVIQRIPQGPHPERAAVCLQVFGIIPALITDKFLVIQLNITFYFDRGTAAKNQRCISTDISVDTQRTGHVRLRRTLHFLF